MILSTFDIQVHVEDTSDTNDWLEYQEYLDMMEEKGIVSKANHVGKREVL